MRPIMHLLLQVTVGLLLIALPCAPVVLAAQGYLHTAGNKIYDTNNSEAAFSGVNWFGFETPNNVVHGLWTHNWKDILDQMKSLGYNSIRLPFSNQMLESGTKPSGIDYKENSDLEGLSALEVMDKIITGAGKRGLKIILVNHRSDAGTGAQSNGLWYTDAYPERRWISDWKKLAERYKGSDAVVAMDLRNKPHGAACWGCGDPAVDWRLAAEKAGNAILSINPQLLILVEGIECYGPGGVTSAGAGAECTWWGGNLMGAEDFPVRLKVPHRLVYSPHDYPASVGSQSWFQEANYPDNLPAVWKRFWGYLHTENIAPVLIGEFGTRYQTQRDRQWFKKIRDNIKHKGLSWTFWSWNPNSGDTGGVLLNDWTNVHSEKQNLLKTIQYPRICPEKSKLSNSSSDPESDEGLESDSSQRLCTVTYDIRSQWPDGFTADVTISNNNSATIKGWTLYWNFPSGQQVSHIWCGEMAQEGTEVAIGNLGWNASIPPNGSVKFGFNGTFSSENDAPAEFMLNGVKCETKQMVQ